MPSVPYLERLTAGSRARFGELGHVRTIPPGSSITLEGDLGQRLWAIHTGLVKVSLSHRDGVELVAALRGPGELLGELAILDDEPRMASATTLVATEVQVIGAAEFIGFLRDDPDAALALTRSLAARLRESDAMRLGQAAEDVTQRLARCLIELARTHGTPDGQSIVIDLPLTQTDLAGIVGASRDAVAKALQAWRERDLVLTSRRRIELLDVDTIIRRHRL